MGTPAFELLPLIAAEFERQAEPVGVIVHESIV